MDFSSALEEDAASRHQGARGMPPGWTGFKVSGVASLKVSLRSPAQTLPPTFPTQHSSPIKGRGVNYSVPLSPQEVVYRPQTSRWRRLRLLKVCLRSNQPVSDVTSKRSSANKNDSIVTWWKLSTAASVAV